MGRFVGRCKNKQARKKGGTYHREALSENKIKMIKIKNKKNGLYSFQEIGQRWWVVQDKFTMMSSDSSPGSIMSFLTLAVFEFPRPKAAGRFITPGEREVSNFNSHVGFLLFFLDFWAYIFLFLSRGCPNGGGSSGQVFIGRLKPIENSFKGRGSPRWVD